MSLGLTRHDLKSAHDALRRARDFKEKNKAHGEHITGTVVRSVLVGGSALAVGTYLGRFPSKQSIGPVPVALGAAVVLHGLGFMGMAGKFDEHLHALGDGALAAYATSFGAGLGTNLLVKSGGSPFAAPATAAPTTTAGFGALMPHGYRPSGASTWRNAMSPTALHHQAQYLRAQAGIPTYVPENSQVFVPHELNIPGSGRYSPLHRPGY